MARRDARHGTRRRRRGPGRVALWAPLLLTLALFGAAVAADLSEFGPEQLGWKGADPSSDPAAVHAPGLGEVPEVDAVAGEAPEGTPLADAVRGALSGKLDRKMLGRNVVVAVADMDGEVAWSSNEGQITPASTTKVLTAVAALETLGPDHRFTTSVERGAAPDEIVLVGGGDPYLSAEPVSTNAFPERADLTTLARDAAAKLAEAGVTKVKLRYDASLFTGPADNPKWERGYVADEVVAPISALAVDSGRDPSGWGRVEDPAKAAATAFASALEDEGLSVGRPQEGKAEGAGTRLASIDSAPVAQIVERVLDVSDNEGAETLAHHVGLRVDDDGSFEGGARAVLSTLTGLGVETDRVVLHDGSGLARGNRVTAKALLQTLALAADEEHPHLRPALDGLPVAGFTGSLARRFDVGADSGLGRVRAKTGTLTGIHLLAGTVTGADGVPMLFVAGADRVPSAKTLDARARLDQIAAALAACRCAEPGSGSAAASR